VCFGRSVLLEWINEREANDALASSASGVPLFKKKRRRPV
jgi:hypothetical protein